MELLPVVAVRLLDGRVGSTMLLKLLSTSDQVVLERRYPEGEARYFSYCLRLANWMATRFDPDIHAGVTEQLILGPPHLGGPIPFETTLVDPARLGGSALVHLWAAVTAELRSAAPGSRYYAEKLAGPASIAFASRIPIRLIDLVRDPRDVFCSIRAFTGGKEGFGRRPGQAENDFLGEMLQAHAARLDEMAATPPEVDRLRLRYEDLATDLRSHAGLIGDWLGVELDAAQVLTARSQYVHHVTSATVEDSIGRWRRELSPGQAERVWSDLGARLETWGYRA